MQKEIDLLAIVAGLNSTFGAKVSDLKVIYCDGQPLAVTVNFTDGSFCYQLNSMSSPAEVPV